jgi:hypothetical protein
MSGTTLEYKLCLPAFREIARVIGPLSQANDDTESNLAAAQVNYELLSNDPGWCKGEEHEQVYFRCAATGFHGWMCVECRRITQVG